MGQANKNSQAKGENAFYIPNKIAKKCTGI